MRRGPVISSQTSTHQRKTAVFRNASAEMQLWNLFTANRRLDCEKSMRAPQDSRRSTDRFAPLREQQEVISLRKMVALVGDETRPGGGWPRAIAAAEHTFGSGPGGLGGVEGLTALVVTGCGRARPGMHGRYKVTRVCQREAWRRETVCLGHLWARPWG